MLQILCTITSYKRNCDIILLNMTLVKEISKLDIVAEINQTKMMEINLQYSKDNNLDI